MKPTANTQTADETETNAFCFRRMETVTDSDCRRCFDAHEQLQAGYQHRSRCVEQHGIEIATFLSSPSVLWNRAPSVSDPFPNPTIDNHPSKERRS